MEENQRQISVGGINYAVIPDAFDPALVSAAYHAVPPTTWAHWVHYDNDCERYKRTCNATAFLPEPITQLIHAMNDTAWIDRCRERLGIADALGRDPLLHGAGLHVTGAGGWLQPHLDYALHPRIPNAERRLNCVLFLNPEWPTSWGGAFELYDDAGQEVIARVAPKSNTAVIWEPTDTAYHGTQAVTCPGKRERVTIAVYYLGPVRPYTTRKRALFVPKRAS